MRLQKSLFYCRVLQIFGSNWSAFLHTSLTDTSTNTPAPQQNILIISKSWLKNNALLEDMARDIFGLLAEDKQSLFIEEKSSSVEEILLLVRKSSQIK